MDDPGYVQESAVAAKKMVDEQLKTRNIQSKTVLQAMSAVPRHLFVPENIQKLAYIDSSLQIGLDQTISQPYIAAYMTEQLEPLFGKKILEIGTGSGYQTALLSYLGCEVYTVELLKELSERSERILAKLNFKNIKLKCANGFSGWPEAAPFDAIIVTAAPDHVPEKLVEQLKEGGKMILPVGKANSVQMLKLITKMEKTFIEQDLLSVIFVPML